MGVLREQGFLITKTCPERPQYAKSKWNRKELQVFVDPIPMKDHKICSGKCYLILGIGPREKPLNLIHGKDDLTGKYAVVCEHMGEFVE